MTGWSNVVESSHLCGLANVRIDTWIGGMLHFMEPAPRIAIILARLSDLRDDDERGVDGQRSSARVIALPDGRAELRAVPRDSAGRSRCWRMGARTA
jgi:hypothetical protein